MYYRGAGVPKNIAEAVKWYGKAANQGDAKAQFVLGRIYRMGADLPQDNAKAFQLIQKAAVQGHAKAQFLLAQFYDMGVGVPEDLVNAYMWFSVAAVTIPLSEAELKQLPIKFRDEMADRMTAEQIAEAQRLAREWTDAHPKP